MNWKVQIGSRVREKTISKISGVVIEIKQLPDKNICTVRWEIGMTTLIDERDLIIVHSAYEFVVDLLQTKNERLKLELESHQMDLSKKTVA